MNLSDHELLSSFLNQDGNRFVIIFFQVIKAICKRKLIFQFTNRSVGNI